MHQLAQLFGNPWLYGLFILYFGLSAFINGMPTPEERAKAKGYYSINYQWAFNSLRFFAGDLKSAFASKIPGQTGASSDGKPTV